MNPTFALRKTWRVPGEDDTDFLVIDSDGNVIGRIYREKATSQGRWQYFVGPGNLPRRAEFAGYADTLDDAKGRLVRSQRFAGWRRQLQRRLPS